MGLLPPPPPPAPSPRTGQSLHPLLSPPLRLISPLSLCAHCSDVLTAWTPLLLVLFHPRQRAGGDVDDSVGRPAERSAGEAREGSRVDVKVG